MYKTVEKLCKNLFDLPTLIIIWTHHSDTILKIERELCKRIGRGTPVPRLPLRLGCKRSAPARPLLLAPYRRSPGQPTADTLPHSFLRTPPDREAFHHGAGLPLGTPRAEQPSSTTKGGERHAALFAFLRSYIIYTRAKGTFRPLGGRGTVRPAVEKRKGGEKRTGRWTFSPHRGKDCGKQIVDKWKIGAHFPPLRNERRRSGERCPSSGAPNREIAARSPQSPTRGGENLH